MSVTTSPSALLAELRDRVHGRVIGPDDADYDQARTVTMGGIDRHPVAIVRVADTDDVTKVIATARESRPGAGRPQRRPQREPATA